MSDKEPTITASSTKETSYSQEEDAADRSSQEEQTLTTPRRKPSVHSFRVMEAKESESDKDLVIHSLNESLHIHKEILEKIQSEKEAYHQQIEKERELEKQQADSWRQASERALEEQLNRCSELEYSISQLRRELEIKKEDYKKLEVKFYSYVKQIRVTDDDLSTIQPEISHLLSQLNNTCMGLKSKMNREQGTIFVFKHWEHRTDLIRKYMIPSGNDSDLLDTSYITFFVEKYLIHTLLQRILDVPIHLGVSINDSFQEVNEWMASRNKEWANRLRQQVCALVVQQPGDEEKGIADARQQLLDEIVEELHPVYPSLKQDPKKIENLISRASKLNLAIKGQEIKIERLPIEEGVTRFDGETMKATAKGKPDGIVFLSITPTFVARDEVDNEHGFTIPGKVFCIEEVTDHMEEDQHTPDVDKDIKENTSHEEESDDESSK
ncbi:hypothetical protein A0J61_06815 [Choanephora cucurbitarum]|uniref:Uncharacterized protein n=1 Tax=Choanephora cucurbitarum TaxID=101091 RepID=A0A1C7N852_9FUNG|nr:hypothetical protein A0J61_06815 [Choanephora cucurbitarum]